MRTQIEAFVLPLRDLALAAWDMLIGRRRRRYAYEVAVRASKEIVGRLLVAPEVVYERQNIRLVNEPIPGIDGGTLGRTTIAGKPGPAIASQRTESGPDRFRWHYLAELSVGTAQIGADDVYTVSLEALPDGTTLMRGARELTHLRLGTRVSAPMGVRAAAWLVKLQAEKEASGSAEPSHPWLRQGIWLLAGIASFWWLAGWQDAIILVLLIALHELGHAAAMVATGRGVRMLTLIPFLGGMAVPKRAYDSEWQHAFVALMGPGLSLIPTFGLFWLAASTGSWLAAHAALLFAFINAINLVPLTPLDGGVVVNALLHSIHSRLARAIAWLGIGAGLGLAVYLESIVVGIVFALGGLQLIWQASFDVKANRRPLTWPEGTALTAAFVLTALAYVWLMVESSRIEGALS